MIPSSAPHPIHPSTERRQPSQFAPAFCSSSPSRRSETANDGTMHNLGPRGPSRGKMRFQKTLAAAALAAWAVGGMIAQQPPPGTPPGGGRGGRGGGAAASFPDSSGRPEIPRRSRAARRSTASIARAATAPTFAAATWADPTCCARKSRIERQRRRADRPDHSWQPAEQRHARHPDERRRREGRGRLRSQRHGDHRPAGHAARRRQGSAEHPGRQRQGRTGRISTRSARSATPRPAICKGSPPESPTRRCCRMPGSAAAAVDVAGAAPRQLRAPPTRAPSRRPSSCLPAKRWKAALVRIDDFLVTCGCRRHDPHLHAERRRSEGGGPRPDEGASRPARTYTDKDMHDVTAYLVTLK